MCPERLALQGPGLLSQPTLNKDILKTILPGLRGVRGNIGLRPEEILRDMILSAVLGARRGPPAGPPGGNLGPPAVGGARCDIMESTGGGR